MKAFIEKLLQKAKAQNLIVEVYALEKESIKSKSMGEERVSFSASQTQSVGIRVLYNQKFGYASTEAFDDEAIDMLLSSALESAKYSESEDEAIMFQGAKQYPTLNIPQAPIASPNDLFEASQKLHDTAINYSPYIDKVAQIEVETSTHKKIIANTYGMYLEAPLSVNYGYAYVQAKKNDDLQVGGAFAIGHNFNALNFEKTSQEACDNVLEILDGTTPSSGQYNIIFKNEAMGMLLSVFQSSFYAQSIQEGLSLLKDKEKTSIASSCVQLLDEPHRLSGMESIAFDDEGVPTQNKFIIQNGMFNTALHNLKTAKKAGVESTGNAGKQGIGGKIDTQTFNLHFVEGEHSFEELLAQMQNGIVICDLAGLHAGANVISGDFSLAAKGYVVKNGVRQHAASQFTVAGNFFTLLQNIQSFANDLVFVYGSTGSPSCFVGEMTVAGQ